MATSLQHLLSDLPNLQKMQNEHDVRCHSDIYNQSPMKRMTHYTLHLTKYLGPITRSEFFPGESMEYLAKTLTDAMIITLAAANCMNVNLQKRVGTEASKISVVGNYTLLTEYIYIVSGMAKACESLDHLEDFLARQALEGLIVRMVVILNGFSQQWNLDLTDLATQRWKQIEQNLKMGCPIY